MSNRFAFCFRGTPAALVVSVLVLSSGLLGQQQGISGLVTDNTGAVVPNAKVRIINEATGVGVDIATNQAGNYSAPSLIVGKYTVEISAPGFTMYRQTGLALNVNGNPRVDATFN